MDENLLYYGDNLDVLRRHVKDESVDLVYLDPPFKSNQDYNVLFAEHGAVVSMFRDRANDRPARVSRDGAFRLTRRPSPLAQRSLVPLTSAAVSARR
jgi:hypothetical protein